MYHYEFVKSILQRQQLSLPLNNASLATDRSISLFFALGRDDKPYMTLPPGLAVASLPLGSLGFLIENITTDNSNETEGENNEKGADISAAIRELGSTRSAIMAAMVNPLAMALLTLVFFLFSNRLGRDRKRALASDHAARMLQYHLAVLQFVLDATSNNSLPLQRSILPVQVQRGISLSVHNVRGVTSGIQHADSF